MLATGVWTAQRGSVPLGACAMLTLSLREREGGGEKGEREREEVTKERDWSFLLFQYRKWGKPGT